MTSSTRIFHNLLSLVSSRKVWMMILVILSLSMSGMANLEINGSSGWINTTMENVSNDVCSNKIQLSPNPNDGLISYWTLDNCGTDWNTTSANNLTLQGGISYSSTAMYGNSIYFPDDASKYINFTTPFSKPFTITLMYRPSDDLYERMIFGKTLFYSLSLNKYNKNLMFGIFGDPNINCQVEKNNWYFVSVSAVNNSYRELHTVNVTSGLRCDTVNTTTYTTDVDFLMFGRPTNGASRSSYGYIDDIHVFNKLLTDDERNLTLNQSKYSSGYIKSWYNSSPNETNQIDVDGTWQTDSNNSLQIAQNGSLPTSYETPENISAAQSWSVTKYNFTDSWLWFFGNGTSTSLISSITYISAPPDTTLPNITSWSNNKTNNNTFDFTLNTSESVTFNLTSNQTILTWNWYINDVNQNVNYDNFTTSFYPANVYIVTGSGSNANGTSNIIQWNVTTLLNSTCPGIITGIQPNQTTITTVNINTTWDGVTNCELGGTLTGGNASQRVYFTIINSTITTQYDIRLNGAFPGKAINFTLENSTIQFNVTSGTSGGYPPAGNTAIINTTQLIYVNTSRIAEGYGASRLILKNSTIRGTNYTYRANGFYIESGGLWGMNPIHPQEKNTVIIDNLNLSFMGGLVSGTGYYALSTLVSSDAQLENDTSINNVTLYYDGKGLKLDAGTTGSYIHSIDGSEPFSYGKYWNNLTALNSMDMFEQIADGGYVKDGNIITLGYKFNAGYISSNTVFDNITIYYAAVNMGDGTPATAGRNNTLQNSHLNQTGVGSRKNDTKLLNNTIYQGSPAGGNIPINMAGWGFLIQGNTITKGLRGLQIVPHEYYLPPYPQLVVGNHTIKDNTFIDSENYAIYISNETNNTFINNTIISPDSGIGIILYYSDSQLFVDNNLSDNAIYMGGTNTNISWINNLINGNTIIGEDRFNNYYYADINITNSTGSPISGATISFTNTINVSYPSINRVGTTTPSYTTDAYGHSPLPIGNDSTTPVLMNMSKNSTSQENMTYTVNVNDSSFIYPNINTSINSTGYNSPQQPVASITIAPNSSWYRSNPNTYQNTTTIQLPNATNWSILPDTTISVNASSDKNLTATWSGSATVLFNTTILEWASQVLYLQHNGIDVDNKTANITGFVNFSYTGTNGDFNVSNESSPTSSITIPSNSWGMFNNWSTYNTTFANIASNESNDVTYTYYNTTSGEWESYYIGYTYSANNPIGQHNSVLGFFNAETTITANTATPSDTSLLTGWNMLYVEGTSNRTLSTIETNIETSPCTVSAIYSFNLTTQDYVSTGTESVQPNQGFIAYIDSDCTWTRTTI